MFDDTYVTAIADFAGQVECGYLSLSAGEKLKVRYRGSEATSDEGWLYGNSVASGLDGWFEERFTCKEEEQSADVSLPDGRHSKDVAEERSVDVSLPDGQHSNGVAEEQSADVSLPDGQYPTETTEEQPADVPRPAPAPPPARPVSWRVPPPPAFPPPDDNASGGNSDTKTHAPATDGVAGRRDGMEDLGDTTCDAEVSNNNGLQRGASSSQGNYHWDPLSLDSSENPVFPGVAQGPATGQLNEPSATLSGAGRASLASSASSSTEAYGNSKAPREGPADATRGAMGSESSATRAAYAGVAPSAFSDARLGKHAKADPSGLKFTRDAKESTPGSKKQEEGRPPPATPPRSRVLKPDPDTPLHTFSTEELKEMAKEMGLPHCDSLLRRELTENISEVLKWQAMSDEELRNRANTLGVTSFRGVPRESLLKMLISQVYDNVDTSPTPASPSAPSSPSAPAAASSAAASSASAEPAVAAQVPPLPKVVELPSKNLPTDEALAAEVRRINSSRTSDYHSVLDVRLDSDNIDTARSHYRHLMRLLHPDKRTPLGEELAGGKEACEQAIAHVQAAIKLANDAKGRSSTVAAAGPTLATPTAAAAPPKAQASHAPAAAHRAAFVAAPKKAAAGPSPAANRAYVRQPLLPTEPPPQHRLDGPLPAPFPDRGQPFGGMRRLIVCD